MATITERKRGDGVTVYGVQIRVQRDGRRHTESATFGSRRKAELWAKRREAELAANGLPAEGAGWTVAQWVEWYERDVFALRPWGPEKAARLRSLAASELGGLLAAKLTASALLDYVARRRKDVAPATVLQELTWLRVVLDTAHMLREAPVAVEAVRDAIRQGRMLGALAESARRERRPTAAELELIRAHFRDTYRGNLPMLDIIDFALLTGRRLSEICRLRIEDVDRATESVLVRDLKHPTRKTGNHQSAKLLTAALELIDRVRGDRESGELFPFRSKSISHLWWSACQVLGVEDLHIHDLRHEAICRLFERGYSIQEVAQFSLHESWSTLRRYTHLRPADVPQR